MSYNPTTALLEDAVRTASQELLACYQEELSQAAARMDNAGGYNAAYRNAQADWCNAADIIHNLRTAHLSPTQLVEAERQHNEIGNAHYATC